MCLQYDECEFKIVEKYTYLGIVLNEHREYSMIALILANSHGSALRAIYHNYNFNKVFAYTKLCYSVYIRL